MMPASSISRRTMFVVGALATLVPDVASARTVNEDAVRKWYKLWVESTDWASFDAIMTDDFTFTAASGEDHISKATFKHQCWDNQAGHIKGMNLVELVSQGDKTFVKYICQTVGGNSFRNVELVRVRNGKIASIECYFGSVTGYPTAADSKKS